MRSRASILVCKKEQLIKEYQDNFRQGIDEWKLRALGQDATEKMQQMEGDKTNRWATENQRDKVDMRDRGIDRQRENVKEADKLKVAGSDLPEDLLSDLLPDQSAFE